MRRASAALLAIAFALAALAGCSSDGDGAADEPEEAPTPERVVSLLDAVDETILGQDLSYPEGDAEVTAAVLTLQPGEETGWHTHEAPLFAYVLEGAVTVDYGDEGERTYEAGEAIMEAVDVSHNGMTEGDQPVRILVVNLGSDTVENTVSDE